MTTHLTLDANVYAERRSTPSRGRMLFTQEYQKNAVTKGEEDTKIHTTEQNRMKNSKQSWMSRDK